MVSDLDLSIQTKPLAGAMSADESEICGKNYMTKQYQALCFSSVTYENQTLKVFILLSSIYSTI